MRYLNLSLSLGLDFWFTALFTVMLAWAFYEFHDEITMLEGKEILLGLFSTLTFGVMSIISFYYVARANKKPQF